MKKLIFAAMISVSSVALAQATDPAQDSGSMPSDSGTQSGTMSGDSSMQNDTSGTTSTDSSMQSDTGTTSTDSGMQSGTSGTMSTDSSMQSGMSGGAGTTVAPGNASPERDARGIAVVSDPATAPAGANQTVSIPAGAQVMPNSNQGAVFTAQSSSENYPACSKTVTDNCVQAYERGSRPR